jgi:hypothetical protein
LIESYIHLTTYFLIGDPGIPGIDGVDGGLGKKGIRGDDCGML